MYQLIHRVLQPQFFSVTFETGHTTSTVSIVHTASLKPGVLTPSSLRGSRQSLQVWLPMDSLGVHDQCVLPPRGPRRCSRHQTRHWRNLWSCFLQCQMCLHRRNWWVHSPFVFCSV